MERDDLLSLLEVVKEVHHSMFISLVVLERMPHLHSNAWEVGICTLQVLMECVMLVKAPALTHRHCRQEHKPHFLIIMTMPREEIQEKVAVEVEVSGH